LEFFEKIGKSLVRSSQHIQRKRIRAQFHKDFLKKKIIPKIFKDLFTTLYFLCNFGRDPIIWSVPLH